jgi:hypothetical protein
MLRTTVGRFAKSVVGRTLTRGNATAASNGAAQVSQVGTVGVTGGKIKVNARWNLLTWCCGFFQKVDVEF